MLYTGSVDKAVGAGASAGDVALPNCDASDNRWHGWQTAAQNTKFFNIINKIDKVLKKFNIIS